MLLLHQGQLANPLPLQRNGKWPHTLTLLKYGSPNNYVLYESNATETKHYLYGRALCLAEFVTDVVAQETEWRHYLYDGNGYVRQTVDENATPTYAWPFSPEGAVLLGEQGPVTHLFCNGDAVYDWSTGLIYKNGNYFDPNTGIWLTIGVVVASGRPAQGAKSHHLSLAGSPPSSCWAHRWPKGRMSDTVISRRPWGGTACR